MIIKDNSLPPNVLKIIRHQATEKPLTSQYEKTFQPGTYLCRGCGIALFRSYAKFNSGCGWPSFDDAIEGAIKEVPDPDGIRTEIQCARCGAHLGHIFEGEGLTKKNLRHCVNSISMTFTPEKETDTAKAYFAGGCFWGVEYHFEHKDGVISVVSGYMGGTSENPTYEKVCSGKTGHLEVVKVTYDPNKVSYEELAKFFFEIHDPTQPDGQGPDIGEQYKSAIFYSNDEEKRIAYKLIGTLEKKGYDVITRVLPVNKFWRAEDYHQDYYERRNQKPYCHIYKKIF